MSCCYEVSIYTSLSSNRHAAWAPVIGVVETRFGTLTIVLSTHLSCYVYSYIRLPEPIFHTLSALDTPSQPPHVLLSHVLITGCRPSNLTSRDYPSQAGNSVTTDKTRQKKNSMHPTTCQSQPRSPAPAPRTPQCCIIVRLHCRASR